MAVQNFLAGGYYGKLGATVGQRWKNKRTIRTYVVPANPRTEVQQANRNKFANAVTYAQMGMQMNYYATCFSDPNFTHWNYRMKVARELKNNGLTGLDLIPLYPTAFVPPTLVTEITKDTVTGRKHISFAVPSLSGNADRVLSLMFALYDAEDHYLGLKLYIGYYYASNPGYLEVDVDDIDEINEHCFVRLVSNDDEDSTTDLIASPSLQVQASSIEIRDFNTDIVSFSKNATGITVTFAELWKGAASTNEITATVHFISDGQNKSASVSAAALIENNGYCAVFIPYVTSDNQNLPAFPSGSDITITSVEFDGATWQYTKENVTKSLVDTDLTRNIVSSPSWNASATGDITFNMAFGGTVTSETKNFNMVCSGRFGDRRAESQSFTVAGNGTNLVFTCTGSRKDYPMMQSGDQIALTAQSFVCNGVTYQLAAQNVALRNAIRTSNILSTATLDPWRDGQATSSSPLITLAINFSGDFVAFDELEEESCNWVSSIANSSFTQRVTPTWQTFDIEEDSGEAYIALTANIEDATHYENIRDSWMVGYDADRVTIRGIDYILPQSSFPMYVSGYPV